MLAAIAHVMPRPRSGIRVQRLGDVGFAVLTVGDGEGVQQINIVGPRDMFLGVVVQDVGHCLERLGGGEGPGLAAPPTAAGLQEEHRVVALSGGRAKGSLEILRVH